MKKDVQINYSVENVMDGNNYSIIQKIIKQGNVLKDLNALKVMYALIIILRNREEIYHN